MRTPHASFWTRVGSLTEKTTWVRSMAFSGVTLVPITKTVIQITRGRDMIRSNALFSRYVKNLNRAGSS